MLGMFKTVIVNLESQSNIRNRYSVILSRHLMKIKVEDPLTKIDSLRVRTILSTISK